MQNKFRSISLSHKNAPVEIREIIAIDEASIHSLLIKLKEFFSVSNTLILSTCNRTEIYYSHELDLSTEIIKLIGLEKGITDIVNYLEYFRILNDEVKAIRHLFNVSMGLEAQVVGDMQISNQVKRAYQASADLDMAGPFLHRLMHTVFFTNKRVVQETAFRDGAASVSYAAVELIGELTSNTYQPRILLIGVGEIGEDVAKNMVHLPDAKITITNRTFGKAKTIADEMGFDVIPFENCFEAMKDADVIVSSIMKSEPFITKSLVKSFDIQSYKLFVDLSVPRSIDTSVEDVPGAILYNVDNIRSKASETLKKRLAAIPLVEQIIEESISDFYNWKKEMSVSPTINKLKNALEQIRLEEMERFLKNADEKQYAIIDKVTKSMMQKILKVPVVQLRAACKRDEADQMIDLISDLFDLEKINEKSSPGI
ncbi:glutamyl-tRNA reductase [Rhodonellum psychrophilum GCM71 = DSM 17998]|uniref:Glutamyl-tRNA reductase n=2 Tax=Rhodonellum TaxID=336827 RepID=U5C3I3_9BACT|nr:MULTISPECIES: glutamyl-tRNA reductase [Rhodonellum]ERM84349.1 glutamyl-tRNA reductase [Rhodonellum psychrophilum GCM71 = DSM 17998]MDO9551832.1 glutamyl-tRNA reductase [Rhodonellum sp.]